MSSFTWPLDREGFVQHFLVSGPRVTPFTAKEQDANLLRSEAALRGKIARHVPVEGTDRVDSREKSRLGLPWRFQGGRDCTLLNLSDFYSTMQRVEFDAATALWAPEERQVTAVLWSYAAVDLYCNGVLKGALARPVYKPIQRKELTLPLRKGLNILYLACETLGVRDTRSVVGLQILSGAEGLGVSLPEEGVTLEAAAALAFLEGAGQTNGRVVFSSPAPAGAAWARGRGYEPDHEKAHLPQKWLPLEKISALPFPEGMAYLTLRVPIGQGYAFRTLERTEAIVPRYVRPVPSPEENRRLIFRRIGEISSFDRCEEFGFPIANLLARQYLGVPGEKDEALLWETLRLIETRVDCADFLVCGLLRYLKNYPVSPALAEKTRRVLTGWRYWMDQDGFDGMCFWSENHCLMFYTSALLAGEMYPEERFPRARRTGRELSAWGRGMVLDWLADVEENGFEEFHSTVYMCVTLAALLNVIDYTEEAISRRAAALTDRMLNQLADHTFRGGIIAPQGRVYRGALYPFQAGAMALMNLADPSQPWDLGEGWLSFSATSKYRFPEGMAERMRRDASLDYTSGNARIRLEKRADWCLTSVQIPREPFRRWENIARKPEADPAGHAFVKSFNECFHGTTCLQPGGYGYQQHLWYAALDGAAAIFVNHPGSSSEQGDLRPGYWHGNGVLPALRQRGDMLGMIYRIPREHPFHYIHLYAPKCRFDRTEQKENWLFLQKDRGYIAFWSSGPLEPWQGMNADCEMRIYGDSIACLCLCGGREYPDLETFFRKAEALNPVFDRETGVLRAGNLELAWQQGADTTQYLD